MGVAASVLESDIEVEHLPAFRAEMGKKISNEMLRSSKEDKHPTSEDLEKYMAGWLSEHGAKLKDETVAFITSKNSTSMDVMSGVVNGNAEKSIAAIYVDKIREKNTRYYLLAVDGSPQADLAVQVALKLRRKNDFLHAWHSFNHKNQSNEKNDFPEMKMEAIKTKLEIAMTSNLLPTNYEIDIRERADDVSSKSALLSFLEAEKKGFLDLYDHDKRKPDFMIMGFTGNKTRHGMSADGEPFVIGSTTKSVLRAVHIPIILVKKDIPDDTKRRVFVVLVSPNPHSQQCLDLVLCLARPKDKLLCVYVGTRAAGQEKVQEILQAQYEAELNSVGPVDSSFVVLAKEGEQNAQDVITDYINFKLEEQPDFVALAPREHLSDTKEVGFSSLTDHLVENARANIIICKH